MPFNPIILAESTLSIDGDAFEGQINSAVFTPSSSPVTFSAINGQTYTAQSPATWTLDLGYAQDWAYADALSRYLHEHEGETVPAVFEPVDGQPSVTASIVITPGAIGGAAAAFAESTVSLGVSGKPVVAAAP
jgi:hypothetical protein